MRKRTFFSILLTSDDKDKDDEKDDGDTQSNEEGWKYPPPRDVNNPKEFENEKDEEDDSS